jgi:hypothetical protein
VVAAKSFSTTAMMFRNNFVLLEVDIAENDHLRLPLRDTATIRNGRGARTYLPSGIAESSGDAIATLDRLERTDTTERVRINDTQYFDDIHHYQQIVKAMVMTEEIMYSIDLGSSNPTN